MSIVPPPDPELIVLGYNPAIFVFAFLASLILMIIWESRTGGL